VETFRIELKHLARYDRGHKNKKKKKHKHNKVSEHLTDKGFDLLRTLQRLTQKVMKNM
jgi:predicted transcriptional regulator